MNWSHLKPEFSGKHEGDPETIYLGQVMDGHPQFCCKAKSMKISFNLST